MGILSILKVTFIQSPKRWPFLTIPARIYDKITSINWFYSSLGKRHQKKLKSFHNKYYGKRCFIIGNGPSLNKMNLEPLKKEYTFGLNRFYLLKKKFGFDATFLVSVNPLVLRQFSKEIKKVPSIKFIRWKSRSLFKNAKRTIFSKSIIEQKFSKDITRGVWEGSTVTYVALQLAYYMGFTQVILIGVDHSFRSAGKPHKRVVSKGNDKDHFDKSYFGKGFEWNLPDLVTSERAYEKAKIVFEEDGREIYDATVGGKLRVYKKVKYSSLFK